MAKQQLTHRLPQARITQELYRKVLQVARAQEMTVADIQRAALEYYCAPDSEPSRIVRVPIIGEIVNGKLVLYRREGKKAA